MNDFWYLKYLVKFKKIGGLQKCVKPKVVVNL